MPVSEFMLHTHITSTPGVLERGNRVTTLGNLARFRGGRESQVGGCSFFSFGGGGHWRVAAEASVKRGFSGATRVDQCAKTPSPHIRGVLSSMMQTRIPEMDE